MIDRTYVILRCHVRDWSPAVDAMVMTYRFVITTPQVQLLSIPLPCNDLGRILSTCASVAKQCNLVLAKEQWCFALGKVTVGLMSRWRCISDSMVFPPVGVIAWE